MNAMQSFQALSSQVRACFYTDLQRIGVRAKFSLAVSGTGVNLKKLPDDGWKGKNALVLKTIFFVIKKGEWTSTTAGGCKNNASWINNPKFRITTKSECQMVVVLVQSEKEKWNGIGFYVVEDIESKQFIFLVTE